MWIAKIIRKAEAPKWFGNKDTIELNETQFNTWEQKGVVKGIKHFRYVTEHKTCKHCDQEYKHRKKIAFKKQKKPRITIDGWD